MATKSKRMYVVKRDGREENVMFDKITTRIEKLCFGLDRNFIEPAEITMKVISGLYPGVTTAEVDSLTAETAAAQTTKHPDFGTLAARIAVSNLHKDTCPKFSETVTKLYNYINPKNGRKCPMINDTVYNIILKNADRLDAAIKDQYDYNFSYFGFKTLERSYLLKFNGKAAERPQHLYMRVSVGIHLDDIDAAIETYELMASKLFTHASPTLYNSGTPQPQMSSCFLLAMKADSIDGIYDTLKQTAMISKSAGGIGLALSTIRSTGSYIAGTNGTSNGLLPLLRVFNNTARYVDQGGNKRPGAFAVYLEPWHGDIFDFLDAKKNTGKEESRARDLFYALWIPDLFMRRVETGKNWTLMCPHECPGLTEVYGEEFDAMYERYEQEGRGRRTIPAQNLWKAIIESQVETGTPYMLYKDSINLKSNQKNIGTIHCSNLCTEIVEYTSKDEVAVCNLASIALPTYVNTATRTFDFEMFARVVTVATRNLNKIIEGNYYPVPEAKYSNFRHRPIGLGVQGLADCFILMRFPFDSPQAQELNIKIFETMYYAAVKESCELAKKFGPYETFPGSPISQGQFQFDLWGVKPSDRHDWDALRADVVKYGVRNSLLVAPMPTASTAQILGNNESFEPYTSNVYSRRVLSGEFQCVNQHLIRDLAERKIWNDDIKHHIISHGGSVQNIQQIPDDLKALYRTVWEIPQKNILKMAADRAPFIDQTQSLNIHIAEPTFGKITSMHFYGWKLGLKTGMYYLRTKPASNPIQFSVDKAKVRASQEAGGRSLARKKSSMKGEKATGPPSAAVLAALAAANNKENGPVVQAAVPEVAVSVIESNLEALSVSGVNKAREALDGARRVARFLLPSESVGTDSERETQNEDEDEEDETDEEDESEADPKGENQENRKAARKSKKQREHERAMAQLACSLQNREACSMCSG